MRRWKDLNCHGHSLLTASIVQFMGYAFLQPPLVFCRPATRFAQFLNEQPPHIAIIPGEKASQLVELVRAVRQDRLADRVMEQPGDKRLVRLVAAGQEPGKLLRVGEIDIFSPARVTNDPEASIGLPFSLSRKRPIASKFSSVNPSGLMMPWQPRQSFGLVCRVMRSRVLRSGCNSAASGVKALAGWRSDTPRTFRARNTPR